MPVVQALVNAGVLENNLFAFYLTRSTAPLNNLSELTNVISINGVDTVTSISYGSELSIGATNSSHYEGE